MTGEATPRPGGCAPRPRLPAVVRGILLVLALAGLVTAAAVVAAVPPAGNPWYPKCLSQWVTGTHCPGCGTARAAHAGLNGRFAQAAAYNVLAVVAAPVLAVVFARGAWIWVRGRSARPVAVRPVVAWAVLAGVILFWVLRNVPAYPFTLLAPHELR